MKGRKNIWSYNNSYFYHSFIFIAITSKENEKGDGERKTYNFIQKLLNF